MTAGRVSRDRLPIDTALVGLVLILVVIGLLMVFESTYLSAIDSKRLGHDAYYFVKRQGFGSIVGTVAMFAMLWIGWWRMEVRARPIIAVGVALLIAVFVPHVGLVENHAHRWLKLGPLTFQPSESAKLAIVIYAARVLSRNDADSTSVMRSWGSVMLVMAVCAILIEREPDLGTAMVLFLGTMTQIYVSGARKRHTIGVLAVAAVVALLLGLSAHGHGGGSRIWAWLHPNRDPLGIGYQTTLSKDGIGAGGLAGVGLGRGQIRTYLPQADTDFIFATVAEELGFVGAGGVILCLALVAWRGLVIAYRCRDRSAKLLAVGIASMVSYQALINVGVATTAIPATGVPLPFISFGSSSLIIVMAEIGILLSIGQCPERPASTLGAARLHR